MKTLVLFSLLCAGSIASVSAFAAEQPKALEVAVPGYPRLPDGSYEEGEVVVDLELDSGGKVLSAKAMSGPDRLRRWAEAAALKWRFEASMPGTIRLVFAFVSQRGQTDPPAVAGIFTPPNRVVVIAEKRDLVIIADPPLENMGKQKAPKKPIK